MYIEPPGDTDGERLAHSLAAIHAMYLIDHHGPTTVVRELVRGLLAPINTIQQRALRATYKRNKSRQPVTPRQFILDYIAEHGDENGEVQSRDVYTAATALGYTYGAICAARCDSRVRCGRCGNRFFSQVRHDDPDHRVRRYVCLKGPDHGGCGRLTVVAEPVEQLLTDAVLTRLDSPHLAEVLAGKSSTDHDVAALAAAVEADQAPPG
jgi:hypothetical protein